jgi:hypothetical protein
MSNLRTSDGRWFKRQDGVLFVAVDDLIADYKAMQKDGLNPSIEVIIIGLEASKEISEKAYQSLSINDKNNDQGESLPST